VKRLSDRYKPCSFLDLACAVSFAPGNGPVKLFELRKTNSAKNMHLIVRPDICKDSPVLSQPTNVPSLSGRRIASGTVPVNAFPDKIRFCSLFRDENSGNEPDNSFELKLIVLSNSI